MTRTINWDHHPGEVHQELNYLVSEATTQAVRDHLASYVPLGVLDLDERCVGQPNLSHSVHTIYLDSDELTLYWQAANDHEHRKELRIRYYSLERGEPVYPEVKRRQSDVVLRQRCGVREEAIPLLLAGQGVDPEDLFSNNVRGMMAAQHFTELLVAINAKPKLHVAYQRECYVDPTNAVRVSLDRQIVCEPCVGPELSLRMNAPRRLFAPFVLLELNYGRRCPNWFLDLVEHFNLTSCAADKYLEGMGTWLSSGAMAGNGTLNER